MKTPEQIAQLRNTIKTSMEHLKSLAVMHPEMGTLLDMLHLVRINLSWVLEDADWDKSMEDGFQNYITGVMSLEKKNK